MLEIFTEWLVFNVFKLNAETRLGEALHFFIYDSIKIILLLFVMIAIVGFLRTYIPPEKIKKWLSKGKFGISNLFASLFGAITPFCSCSSIPLFLSFIKAGVPLGVTFSFLITSPLVNEYLVVLMWGFFGWKITAAYVVFGILIGVFAGIILGKMKLEKHLVKDMINKVKTKAKKAKAEKLQTYKTFMDRINFGIKEAVSITKKLWLWVIVGVAIGAGIHNFVPEATIQAIIFKGGIFTVPIATLLGVPMYGSCAAIVPIAVVLFQKGIPLGTALAFMMATAALSLPEAIILRRAMKLRLILIFFAIVTVGIIIVGYLINFLQGWLV
ncbi:permease [Candidatus Woesearchaeota archaeon]|jgi:uncharacterized protein|nr:permease [Candidatus Woesearchaeota archaeon]MBT5271763.1 permease [Candidatus Woesearchaeota archaeon]MBT6041196.1 permease [Candidatus Woesearchaeota archaeon]MBT6336317.1 permease [Candidatus Woesearchaeota archaeon]MBT7927297.1 permease [Candidatus Woesearchaeota archaeon]